MRDFSFHRLPSKLLASWHTVRQRRKTEDKRQKTGFKMLALYFLLYIRAEHTHSKYKKVTVLSVICQPSADRCGWMLNLQPIYYWRQVRNHTVLVGIGDGFLHNLDSTIHSESFGVVTRNPYSPTDCNPFLIRKKCEPISRACCQNWNNQGQDVTSSVCLLYHQRIDPDSWISFPL